MGHRFQLRLIHKGLGLVVLLLLMELMFVGWLAYLLDVSNKHAEELRHQRSVMVESESLFKMLGEVNLEFDSRPFWEAFSSETYNNCLRDYPASFDRLEQLVAGDEPKLETLRKARRTTDETIQLMEDARVKLQGQGFSGIATALDPKELQRFKKLIRHAEKMRNQLLEMMFEFQTSVSSAEDIDRIDRAKLQSSLVVIGLLNVILATVLALMFVRSITSRVDRLVDNTIRLAASKPLNPAIPGTDEIAHLDTTFHQMAQSLEEASAKERELQEMKERFVAMASHELRSPLTAVSGALTMLSEGVFGELPRTAADRVRSAEKNLNRLVYLINDILDNEKMKTGKLDIVFENTDVATILERSVSAVEDLATSKEIKINTSIATDCSVMKADASRLVQVNVNFLSNAIKFSPRGSSIEINVERTGKEMRWSIKDSGRGIAEDQQKTIFEPFKQVAEAQASTQTRGTGLGLAICKQIIIEHGGTIGVTSGDGKGSEFWFSIPQEPVDSTEVIRATDGTRISC